MTERDASNRLDGSRCHILGRLLITGMQRLERETRPLLCNGTVFRQKVDSNPLDYVGIVSNPQRNFEGFQSSVTFSMCCLIRRVFLFLRFENPSNQRGPHYSQFV